MEWVRQREQKRVVQARLAADGRCWSKPTGGGGIREITWVAFPGLFPLTARSRSITLSTCFSVSESMAACCCASLSLSVHPVLNPPDLPLPGLFARNADSAREMGCATARARDSCEMKICVGAQAEVPARDHGGGQVEPRGIVSLASESAL